MLEAAHIAPTSTRKSIIPDGKDEVQGVAIGAVRNHYTGSVVIGKTTMKSGGRVQNRANMTKVLCRFMKESDPSFAFTTIQINKNFAAKPHRDANNAGPSRLIALGDFEGGGELVVREQDGVRTEMLDARDSTMWCPQDLAPLHIG